MIEYKNGNMFQSEADCLINTVNCEGYMGKGIAYQFKTRFPENNKAYIKECRTGRLRPGKLFIFVEDGKTIINFPSKDKWREKSKIEYIVEGMKELVRLLPKLNVQTVVIPPLGCGNGGLYWPNVKLIIERAIASLQDQYNFVIYEPSNQIYQAVVKTPPSLSVSALVLVKMKQGLHKFNKIRLQKCGYFLNMFLGDSYFRFVKDKYGPYSHDIDIVANKIAEYSGYYNIQDTAKLYDAIYQTICSKKTDEKIDLLTEPITKAVDFVNAIDSDHDLEGIATTMFLLSEKECGKEDVWRGFLQWPGDKAERFNHNGIVNYIAELELAGLVSRNLLGQYVASCISCAV